LFSFEKLKKIKKTRKNLTPTDDKSKNRVCCKENIVGNSVILTKHSMELKEIMPKAAFQEKNVSLLLF
jgi:hypothetical protein